VGALVLAVLIGMAVGVLGARSRPRRAELVGIELSQVLRWIEEVPGGWLILDPDDRVHLINARAERLLQCPGAALMHQPSLAQVCAAPEVRELVQSARLRGRLQRVALLVGDQDLELLALPGDRAWVALMLQSRRSLEAQLEQQERWVSDVAHELKTPLTALLLVGDSLAARVTSDNAVLVERLQRELRRLQDLVQDLLELSRLENTLPDEGRPAQRLDLADRVEQVWAGLRPLADQRGVTLRLDHPDAPVIVPGDPSRLHRALLNLLDNALRYSPDGGQVQVRLLLGPQWCLVSVRDQGPGLSEDDLQHLFERFYRGDPSRVRSRRVGSGLGLSIVQQIALTHGGRVQAGNHPEGGALIELLLPLPS
jgi:two-component system phosphate regulon sensor histidine kinase PhoR